MHRAYALIGLVLLFLASCRPPTADRQPLKFTVYEGNPVLGPGKPGEWDDVAVQLSYAISHENVIYLFYSAWCSDGKIRIGLATSSDGFHFEKYPGNPVFTTSDEGFDSHQVAAQVISRMDSVWVMYYNAMETAVYGPGPDIGMATSRELTGPWERLDRPVLSRGSKSEWDGGYIIPAAFIKMEDGTCRLYYTAGGKFPQIGDNDGIGMAASKDGIHWVKYNDPATKDHPLADSDPVLTGTQKGNFSKDRPWSAYIRKTENGFEMYYGGQDSKAEREKMEFFFASSHDGIRWEKYPGNPVYRLTDDPVTAHSPEYGTLEFPNLLYTDSLVFMYYSHMGSTSIRLAVAENQ